MLYTIICSLLPEHKLRQEVPLPFLCAQRFGITKFYLMVIKNIRRHVYGEKITTQL